MKYCPNCEHQLDADTEVYVMGREVVGCEWCMRSTWADEFFDEEELAELEQNYIDDAKWAQAKDGRYGL